MSVTLPDWVSPNAATPRFMDAGIWNKGAMSGSHSRTDRKGSRYAVNITLPPVWSAEQGLELLSDLMDGLQQGLRFQFPQGALSLTDIGAPIANGANIQGTSLPVRGLSPNVVIPKGRFFSIAHGGGHYLHRVASEATANEAGIATLSIEPELRVILNDADPCEFERPIMDGKMEGDDFSWSLRIDKFMDISFDLVERQ